MAKNWSTWFKDDPIQQQFELVNLNYRDFRRILFLIPFTITILVAIIYIVRKFWEAYKRKISLPIVAPLLVTNNMPNFNNKILNPNIIKPKVFIVMLVYMIVVCIGICVHFYVNSSSNSYDLSNNNLNLKLYRISELLLYPLTFSFIFPLYIYINNPSLRQYLLNYLKNDLTIM